MATTRPKPRPALDVAAEMFYGAVYYRWLLRTGPVSREHADTVVAMTLRALGHRP